MSCRLRTCLGRLCNPVPLSLLLLCLYSAQILAQIHNFHHYGAGDGLPQTQVFSIVQDQKGYLWVGTYGGLGRYNGQSFHNFTAADGLGTNAVEALAVDDDGRLWVGTGAGLCRYQDDAFDCEYHERLDQAYVYDLAVDGSDLWAATEAGLFRLSDGQLRDYYRVGHGLPVNDVRSVSVGPDGTVWAGTAEGLVRLTSDGFQPLEIPDPPMAKVTALLAEEGQLWIGTDMGLFRSRDGERVEAVTTVAEQADINGFVRDTHGDLWISTNLGVLRGGGDEFRLLTQSHGLPTIITHSVYRDREGLVWIGHDNGMSKWLPRPFYGYMPEHGLVGEFVRTINEDEQGRLWLGTRHGVQIVPYEQGEWRIDRSQTITAADGLPDERIYSIDFTAPGEALFATDNGVVRWREDEGIVAIYTMNDGLPSNRTQAIWVDHDGGVWIGANLGTVFMADGEIMSAPHPELAAAYSFRIREDDAGRVWFGTRDHGLFVLDAGEVRQYRAAEGLTDQTIWDIAAAGPDSMWVGSNGDGLFHVHADGSIRQYTVEDGLADNFVWQVIQDRYGDVWAYTNRGLSRFDGESFRNYDRDDGLLHEEGGATGAWESHDGSLWFAAAEALMRYDPERSWVNHVPPPVVIERVEHSDELLAEGAQLPYGDGSVTFEFAALTFQSEAAVRYQYRLGDGDDSWSGPIEARPITFASLAGGQYVFEVRARNPDGVWSETYARFPFEVIPPYWQQPWFWLVLAVIAIALVWLIMRWRLRQGRIREQELEALVAERTSQLEAASVTDPLTGLRNRRFLMNQIDTDVAQSQRAYRGPSLYPNRDIVFMMVDLDHFKVINDTHGHLAGDAILRQYGKLLRDQLRDSDYVVRWGGEEFLVVARQAEATKLNIIVERLMQLTRERYFEVPGIDGGLKCTCSIGVSHFPFLRKQPDALSWEQVVDIADTAVYMAKAMGRDGWVAIHGNGEEPLEDAMAFVQRIKTDLAGLVRDGCIRLESGSGDPMSVCSDGESIEACKRQ